MNTMAHEYCVMHYKFPNEPHRGPMPREEAEQWIEEFLEDGGRSGVFYIGKRMITPWVQEDFFDGKI